MTDAMTPTEPRTNTLMALDRAEDDEHRGDGPAGSEPLDHSGRLALDAYRRAHVVMAAELAIIRDRKVIRQGPGSAECRHWPACTHSCGEQLRKSQAGAADALREVERIMGAPFFGKVAA